jgi:hypothetical protein
MDSSARRRAPTSRPRRIALADTSQVAADSASRRLQAQAIAAVAGSRILIFAVAFAAAALVGVKDLPINWRFPSGAEVFTGTLGHLLNPWAHWDGVWLIKIATSGYADEGGSTAFFPLFPSLLRYVGIVFDGNLVITGVVISLACFGGCAWLLHRLVRADFDEAIASRTLVYLAIGPVSFFFQAVYTESLFLLLSLACFVFAREGRLRLAGIMGLLAVLTRSTGVLLLIPMTYYYYQQRDWQFRRTDSHVANLLMIPEGLLVWMTYLSLTFGNPFSFAGAQTQWARMLAAPNYTVGRAIEAAFDGVRQIVSTEYGALSLSTPNRWGSVDVAATNIIALGTLVIAGLLLWYGARRLPPVYSLFALASLMFPLFFPAHSVPLMSFPRFALTVFPLYISLALFTRDRRWAHITVVALGLLFLVLLTAKFALFSWVA